MNCPNCGAPFARRCGECQITKIVLSLEEIHQAPMLECLECHNVYNVGVVQQVDLTARIATPVNEVPTPVDVKPAE